MPNYGIELEYTLWRCDWLYGSVTSSSITTHNTVERVLVTSSGPMKVNGLAGRSPSRAKSEARQGGHCNIRGKSMGILIGLIHTHFSGERSENHVIRLEADYYEEYLLEFSTGTHIVT